MRDLAVQASSDGIGDTERGYLDTEHSKLATTLEAVVNQAKFNDKDLIDYDGTSFSIQSGADSGEVTTISIGGVSDSILAVGANDITLNAAQKERVVFDDFVLGVDGIYTVTVTAAGGGTSTIATDDETFSDMAALATEFNTKTADYVFSAEDGRLVATYVAAGNGTNTNFAIAGDGGAGATADTSAKIYNGTTTSRDSASAAIDVIDTALDAVAKERAKLGATQAQLESTVRNLANVAENTSAAAGRIMDTDYAAETANLTKAQILQQAATSILAQANAQPQSVLALLR
jgi:flagellin